MGHGSQLPKTIRALGPWLWIDGCQVCPGVPPSSEVGDGSRESHFATGQNPREAIGTRWDGIDHLPCKADVVHPQYHRKIFVPKQCFCLQSVQLVDANGLVTHQPTT